MNPSAGDPLDVEQGHVGMEVLQDDSPAWPAVVGECGSLVYHPIYIQVVEERQVLT